MPVKSWTLWPVSALVLAVACLEAGCAECSESAQCSIGQVCSDGGCVLVAGDSIEIVSPPAIATPTFDLVLKVRFRGAAARLAVTRTRGDACVPFVPAHLTLLGDDDQALEQEVVVAGLSSVGDFELAVDLDVNGLALRSTRAFNGPAVGADVGGAVFESPNDGEIDVVEESWQPLRATVEGGRVTAFVAPVGGLSTPRVVVAEGQTVVDTFVPLVRGPQVVWLESEGAEGLRRCGRGMLGGPVADDGGALELALLTDALEPAWLGLSVRVQDANGDTICDSEEPPSLCQPELRPLSPAEHNAEVVRLRIDNGVVELAAVPLVISGQVNARLRVSRAGLHEGFFGPFTVFPGEGQAWFAGRVIIEGGRVVALVPVDEVSLGAPW